MHRVEALGIGLLSLLGFVVAAGIPPVSGPVIAQPPSGNGQLVIVSDEGQVADLGLLPDQMVGADVTLLQSSDMDPAPDWRNRDFSDAGWSVAYPVLRVAPWATTTLPNADHIWGGAPGGPLAPDDGSGTTAYPRRFASGHYDNGHPVAGDRFLFVRKNFCIPNNAQLDGSGDPIVSAGNLSLLAAIDGDITLWLNGLYNLWSGSGDESGGVYSILIPPNAPFERGNNTLSMRAEDSDAADQAALLYHWTVDYTVDPDAIQITSSASPAYVGQSVDFGYIDDGLSNRPPYTPVWDFGDGSGDAASPHTYAASGIYTVTLRLLDSDGCPGVAQATIQVVAPSELTIAKAPDRTVAVAGDVVQFDLSVGNSGSAQTLTGVVVTDTLPAGMGFVWCSDACVQVGRDVRWEVGTLAPNETRVLRLRVQVDPAFTSAQIVNTYRASSAETGLVEGMSVSVQVIQPGTATPTSSPTPTAVPPTPTWTPTAEPPTPTWTPTATPGPPSAPSTPVPTSTPTAVLPVLLPETGIGGGEASSWPRILVLSGVAGLIVAWRLARRRSQ